MIEAVQEWIRSIVMVTMLLSVGQAMIPEGQIRKIFSFAGGLVLMIVLLQPVLGLKMDDVVKPLEAYERQISGQKEELEQQVRAEQETIIEQNLAAYISNQADVLEEGESVRIRAETAEDGSVILSAELVAQPSEPLEDYLEQELGIPRERQVWIHEGER
jgi:stage III sporulation protein AF